MVDARLPNECDSEPLTGGSVQNVTASGAESRTCRAGTPQSARKPRSGETQPPPMTSSGRASGGTNPNCLSRDLIRRVRVAGAARVPTQLLLPPACRLIVIGAAGEPAPERDTAKIREHGGSFRVCRLEIRTGVDRPDHPHHLFVHLIWLKRVRDIVLPEGDSVSSLSPGSKPGEHFFA